MPAGAEEDVAHLVDWQRISAAAKDNETTPTTWQPATPEDEHQRRSKKVLAGALVVLVVVIVAVFLSAPSDDRSSSGLSGNAARYQTAVRDHLDASLADSREFQSDVEEAFANPGTDVALATVFTAGEMYKAALDGDPTGQLPALIVSLAGLAQAEGDDAFDARIDNVNASLAAYALAASAAADAARTVSTLDDAQIAELTALMEALGDARLNAVSAFVNLVPEES